MCKYCGYNHGMIGDTVCPVVKPSSFFFSNYPKESFFALSPVFPWQPKTEIKQIFSEATQNIIEKICRDSDISILKIVSK